VVNKFVLSSLNLGFYDAPLVGWYLVPPLYDAAYSECAGGDYLRWFFSQEPVDSPIPILFGTGCTGPTRKQLLELYESDPSSLPQIGSIPWV